VLQIDRGAAQRIAHHEIAQVIYTGALLLDAKNFDGWLELCAPDFHYAIRAWSPEIRRDITWLDHDRDGLVNLVQQLPRHNTDVSVFTRHTTVYTVDFDEANDTADAVSAVSVYRTELDGGASQLFAVGRYHDRAVWTGRRWLLRSREVRLDTRSLGIGTHYPL
jgi:methanesulfonate monooxygenase small subunit